MEQLIGENLKQSNKRPTSGGIKTSEKIQPSESEPIGKELGLSTAEAEKRLQQYGYNELSEKKENPYLRFLTYLWGPIPWMIEIAAILSAVVKHWEDFIVIMVLLIVNAVVGFWEEYQAGNAIEALKSKLALKARLKRDGQWKILPARELVPGDLISVRMGDIIPADSKLLNGGRLEVDESALTGESLPANRQPGETVYSGSTIRKGEGNALVTATGENTFFGKTVQLVGDKQPASHFQRAIMKIGDYLIMLAMFLVSIILLFTLFRGDELLTSLQFALVLTVAAVPVAMPAVLSITMAVGARVLASKNAIVSRLASIEELSGMDVLCSDKTGTLTQNILTVGEPFCSGGFKADDVMRVAALASRKEDLDPIDSAILQKVEAKNDSEPEHQVIDFHPFDPESKRTEALIEDQSGRYWVTKGAPQVILGLSSGEQSEKQQIQDAINEFASRGFRSLGIAQARSKDLWQFLGIIPLYDPPREDSRSTLESAKQMGVQVKMVTGDQVAIGKEIARQLGLGTTILDASLFEQAKHHEGGQLGDKIEDADGFAQVIPEHKYLIVEELQDHGHFVGMTGDGVNDAPALKRADAGIAVSGATDSARLAADIVLLSSGISVIIDAIQESRKIFRRMQSYAIYRIAETIRVLLFMSLSILIFNFFPVTAIMIVLLALLNDGAILSIAFDRVDISQKPQKWDMRKVLGIATVLGITGVIASFGMFYLGERVFHLNREMIQTLMYLKLSVAGHLTIFITRTEGPFWKDKPSPILVSAVLGTQAIATIFAVYGFLMAPIGWSWAIVVWGYALAWFLLTDQIKQFAYRIIEGPASGWLKNRWSTGSVSHS
jgi:H+-transporting ATPase